MKIITIKVPDHFNWMCRQSDGAIFLSENKPEIIKSDWDDNERNPLQYWDVKSGKWEELEFTSEKNTFYSNWRDSLISLGPREN